MDRHLLEIELEKVCVRVLGWDFTLRCDTCGRRWERFIPPDDESPIEVRPGFWKCQSGCNRAARANPQVEAATPQRVVVNDMTGVVFDEEDFKDFKDYVISVNETEVQRPSDHAAR